MHQCHDEIQNNQQLLQALPGAIYCLNFLVKKFVSVLYFKTLSGDVHNLSMQYSKESYANHSCLV